MEFEPMLTPRKKSPLPKMSPEEDRTRDAVDSEPKHYQRAISAPSYILTLLYSSVGWTQITGKGHNHSVHTDLPFGR